MTEVPARRRLVGGTLRAYREAWGLELDDAARVIGADRSKISRIETGQRGIRRRDLRALLTEYACPDNLQDALVVIADPRGPDGWHKGIPGTLPEGYRDYLALATVATTITAWEAAQVPEFLQTPQYAAALAAANPALVDNAARQAAVDATLGLQQMLGRPGPAVRILIGEAALHQVIGDRDTMEGQLGLLAATGGGTSRVAIRLVPFASGLHPAPWAASLTLLEFAGTRTLRIIRLGSALGGEYLLSDDEVTAHARALDRLKAIALSPTLTARRLRGEAPYGQQTPGGTLASA